MVRDRISVGEFHYYYNIIEYIYCHYTRSNWCISFCPWPVLRYLGLNIRVVTNYHTVNCRWISVRIPRSSCWTGNKHVSQCRNMETIFLIPLGLPPVRHQILEKEYTIYHYAATADYHFLTDSQADNNRPQRECSHVDLLCDYYMQHTYPYTFLVILCGLRLFEIPCFAFYPQKAWKSITHTSLYAWWHITRKHT